MRIDALPLVLQSVFEHKLPPKIGYGIIFIGCIGIVNYGHIPAYKVRGFHLIGGYDLNYETAKKTVQDHKLNKVYGSLDEVLFDPGVQIGEAAYRSMSEARSVSSSEISA